MNDRFKFRSWHEPTKTMEYNGLWTGRDWNKKLSDCNFKLIQCTGLKDKNGKLIYEGDIMLVYEKIKEVVYWGKRQFMLGRTHIYCTNCKKNHYKRTCPTCYKFQSTTATTTIKNFEKSEVIGNIYENKELLNE